MATTKDDKEVDQPSNDKPVVDTDVATKPSESPEGVDISEEYQQLAHQATHTATKHEINHLRSKMNSREDTMRQEEMKKAPTPKKGSFNDNGMSYGD